jgi:hypothetical protein
MEKSYYLAVADVFVTDKKNENSPKSRVSLIQLIYASNQLSAKVRFEEHIEQMSNESFEYEVISIVVDNPLIAD